MRKKTRIILPDRVVVFVRRVKRITVDVKKTARLFAEQRRIAVLINHSETLAYLAVEKFRGCGAASIGSVLFGSTWKLWAKARGTGRRRRRGGGRAGGRTRVIFNTIRHAILFRRPRPLMSGKIKNNVEKKSSAFFIRTRTLPSS